MRIAKNSIIQGENELKLLFENGMALIQGEKFSAIVTSNSNKNLSPVIVKRTIFSGYIKKKNKKKSNLSFK